MLAAEVGTVLKWQLTQRFILVLVASPVFLGDLGCGSDADPAPTDGAVEMDAANPDGNLNTDPDGSPNDGSPNDAGTADAVVDAGPCGVGYELQDGACVDSNECESLANACDPLTECTNTDGSYTCSDCPDGYESSDGGRTCIDVNECEADSPQCAAIACTNTPGGFDCECPTGWADPVGDGSRCIDHNECLDEGSGHDCDANALCTNRLGSFHCQCRPGYRPDGNSCTSLAPPSGFEGGPVFGVDDFVRQVDGADLNGDGELDVVAATARYGDINIFLSDGMGGHADPIQVVVGGETRDIVITDLVGDASPDIVATNRNGNSLSVIEGDGAGGFSAGRFHWR